MKQKVICELIKILKNKIKQEIPKDKQETFLDILKLIHTKTLKIEKRLRLYRAGIEYLGFERIKNKKNTNN